MQKGNISAALNLLTNKMGHGILPLDQKTISQLVLQHPQKSCASKDILINGPIKEVHPVPFESINEELIRRAAIKTKGGSGPSGMDADEWQRILVSNSFGMANSDLRKAFANVAKKLSTDLIETQTIETFLFCRLIPLDKNPGFRPTGVREVLRRIAGKVIVSVLKNDIIDCTGSLQVCASQEAGIEAAVHALNSTYNDENNDAVLLVDASNAFNSLNRDVFLHNISYICPAISVFIKNCYNSPSRLFITGGKELKSNEGTTQGDPVSMAIYGIGVTPLINILIDIVVTSTKSQVRVLAYADDFSAAGKLDDLRKWRDTLTIICPKFGYYPEPTKTWLVIKPYASQQTN